MTIFNSYVKLPKGIPLISVTSSGIPMQIQDTTDLGYQILNHAQMGQMGPRKQMELVLSYAIFF